MKIYEEKTLENRINRYGGPLDYERVIEALIERRFLCFKWKVWRVWYVF